MNPNFGSHFVKGTSWLVSKERFARQLDWWPLSFVFGYVFWFPGSLAFSQSWCHLQVSSCDVFKTTHRQFWTTLMNYLVMYSMHHLARLLGRSAGSSCFWLLDFWCWHAAENGCAKCLVMISAILKEVQFWICTNLKKRHLSCNFFEY